MYSASRLLALHAYCESASRVRVLLVPLLFCMPALIVMIIFDAVPLRDPDEGWRANGVYWLRLSVGAVLICGVILVQVQAVIPEIVFTTTRLIAICTASCIAQTGTLMLLAAYWKFPVPFTYTTAGVPLMVTMNIFVVITLGTGDRARLNKYFQFSNTLSIQTAMLLVYPAYNAVFSSLEGNARLPFVLLLPVIKHTLKKVTIKVTHNFDDLITPLTSSVDVFDALYMTKCMQSAGTLAVGFAIILVDMAQNYAVIRHLAQQTRTLKAVKMSTEVRDSSQTSSDLLTWAAEILSKTESSQWLAFQPREAHILSSQSLQAPTRLQSVVPQRAYPTTPSARSVAIAPTPPVPKRKAGLAEDKLAIEAANRTAIIETAKLLHSSEEVVIVEYIEGVVPVVYAIYMAILYCLPNAKYYTDMEGFTDKKLHSVVTNILIYALMEFLSLVYVHYTLKHRFGISVLRQLAFALESEWPMYQCQFVVWILVVFQFLLVHSGADFTFQFNWDIGRAHNY
ncbi:hypothetical protein Gpo141_00000705 [Globisporangium polare]